MASRELTFERAKDVLRWWAEAGVEAMLDDAPHDRFAETADMLARRAAAAAAEAARAALARGAASGADLCRSRSAAASAHHRRARRR